MCIRCRTFNLILVWLYIIAKYINYTNQGVNYPTMELQVARTLNLEPDKSIKLELGADRGCYFRVTNKEEKSIRGHSAFWIVDSQRGGVRFQNEALKNCGDQWVALKGEYEEVQSAMVKEIVKVAAFFWAR